MKVRRKPRSRSSGAFSRQQSPSMWKAKRRAIGAESSEKVLFVGHDLSGFCLSDELDHVALLSNTLFINERIKKTGMKTEIWNCSNVFVRDFRSVEHQVRHGHGMNFHVRRPHCAKDRRDHIRQTCLFRKFIGLVPPTILNFSFQSNWTHALNAKRGRVHDDL